jgi:NAD(P)-dependent dehydrogenase (short-subunit alcohol dehydrogenase family)
MFLKDKVAIVTGSAMGIGQGIAYRFAREGSRVVIADIADQDGEKTAAEIKKLGVDSFYAHTDVTRKAQIEATVQQTLERFGKIDILVNCAGGVPGLSVESLEGVDEAAWDRIVNLNLKSVYFFCRAVVPIMKAANYGKIVNVSSMGAIHPPASLPHYHAAKAGVLGFTRNMALELAQAKITVNALLPGPIISPFWAPVTKDVADKEAFFKAVAAKEVPMKRMGTPEDVAGVALFLACDLSAYMTGESIFVGGGLPLPVQ